MSSTVAPAATQTLPGWLCQQIVLDTLPWDRALSYQAFCDRYTLHDSHWLGLFQAAQNAVACIRWDTLWLPDTLFNQIDAADTVYLFLNFDQLLGVTFTPGDAVESAETEFPAAIARVELEPVDEQQVLLVNDVNGASTTVVFQGEPRCLAIARQNQVIRL